MKQLTNKHLEDWGYDAGPHYAAMHRIANDNASASLDDIRAMIVKRFGKPQPRIKLRDVPAPIKVALTASTAFEEDNLHKALVKMTEVCMSPVVERGYLMPDACPSGSDFASIPVGGVIVCKNAIVPAAHSADVACSMHAVYFKSKKSVSQLMDILMTCTRFGPGQRKDLLDAKYIEVFTKEYGFDTLKKTNRFLKHYQKDVSYQIGDQGDGNHFAYLGKSKDMYVLVTHHGSRGLGAHVYKEGLKAAMNNVAKIGKDIHKNHAWITADSKEGVEYLQALEVCEAFALCNHSAIAGTFLDKINARALKHIFNTHNMVYKEGRDTYYHAKGSTPIDAQDVYATDLKLIPLNMSEPILVVDVHDANDYDGFAPHGAGRNMSRTDTLKMFPTDEDKFNELKRTTSGLDVRWFSGVADVSESPIGYKNADQVIADIDKYKLAKVVDRIEPLGCIMAGEFSKPWIKK